MATFDNSMLKEFRRCERRYRNLYVNGYMEGESVHLHAGKCLARAIEEVRIQHWEHSNENAIEAGQAALIKEWGSPMLYAEEVKNLRNVTRALHQYFEDFPVDTHYPIHRFPDGKLAVELHFQVPFFGDTYCGTPDCVVEYGGGLWLVDEKTTGSYINEQWAAQWKRAAQFSGYAFGLRYTDHPIKLDGVLVRGIQIQKTQTKCHEFTFPRSDHQVEEWSWETQRTVNRLKMAESSGDWGCEMGDNCVKFNRECEFMKQCQSPTPDYSKFKRGVWVPESRQWIPITPEVKN